MDARYIQFCQPGLEFYDLRESSDEDLFPLAAQELPPGWTRLTSGPWIGLHPEGVELPKQGWKVHVSAHRDNAAATLSTVWQYCRDSRVAMKFLRSQEALFEANAKQADRGSSGKFMTIYPVDEQCLETLLRELDHALAGAAGPYVLSDLRWRQGPLFVRYGGFVERTIVTATGDRVHAIEDPSGNLVPDSREPRFRLPSWVTLPAFLEQGRPNDELSEGEFPFKPKSALQFSNGGGVYLAEDLRDGTEVVLKEARSYAGLSIDGSDAVHRLEREAKVMDRLGDLDVVPTPRGIFTAWEHHFLAMEKIDGLDLKRAVMRRIPILKPSSTDEETQAYTTWALAVLDRIDAAMTAIHDRGVVIGDVHPKNILLRDDQPVFLDFEFAAVDDPMWATPQGAPGFKPPRELKGTVADRWVMGALRLDMFMPLTQMIEYEPGKVRQLIAAAQKRYGLGQDFADQVMRDMFGAADFPLGFVRPVTDITRRFLSDEPVPWSAVGDSIADGILAAATPNRNDRLFPGDIEQFVSQDGLGLAHGAAGGLWALHDTGRGRYPAHEKWLMRRLAAVEKPRPGFYSGLHGVAYCLDGLGRVDDARAVLDRALQLQDFEGGFDLYRGAAGVGLNLLHFARRDNATDLQDRAVAIASRLGDALTGSTAAARSDVERGHAGLLKGWTGPALLGIRLYERTGDAAFLDFAADALRRDLADCTYTVNDTLETNEGYRTLPYLEVGTAGIGMVLTEFLKHRDDDQFRAADAGIDRAMSYEFYVMGTLFAGRAGVLTSLCHRQAYAPTPSVEARIEHLLSDFNQQALPYQGHVAFQGNQALRLSMDVATGSAGVLLALHSAVNDGPGLPFLPTDRSA